MDAQMPTVSVLIPCYNERERIGHCLQSLLRNDYPAGRIELVVIDGHSNDGSRELVDELARRHPNVRVLDNPARGKPQGLNLGIQSTRSDVVVRADAHAWYPPSYVRRLVEDLDRYAADNTGGVRETHIGGSRMARAIGIAISHRFAAADAHYRTGTKRVRAVESVFGGCYRREVFGRIGLFNEHLVRTQDRELNRRLLGAGGRIVLDPQVWCLYFPRGHMRDYWRWTYEGAFWLFYARRFTAVPMLSWRNLVPLTFVLWHVVAVFGAGISTAVAGVAAVPLLGYWGCNAAISWSAARRHGDLGLAPYLALAFVLTHWSYGLGSLQGWLRATSTRRTRP
jgi:glycosyltransferase involved in cell wall biosynthesis